MHQLVYFLVTLLFVCGCGKKSGQVMEDTQDVQPEIGLQLYSLRNEFKADVPGTIDKIQEMGITLIEGGDTYGYSVEDFKQILDEHGLKMVSIGVGFETLTDDLQSAVDLAKSFGAGFVMCPWIPHPGDTFELEHAQRAVDVFNEAGKKFSENGLSFCYHLHGYEFRPYEDGTLFDYIVQNTNPAYVNFEMDVFWVKQPGQDPVALLRKYPDRFHMLHLKDRKHGTPDSQDGHAPNETNVVLGTGDVGIAEIMEQAKRNGVKYYFIEDESPDALTQIPKSLEYLKGL
jgi:sugar phosphate isomerase/epimerase